MLKAVKLRTEGLHNPLGIDAAHPRLSWNLEGDSERQTAFEIRAAHTPEDLEKGDFCWTGGIVPSESMLHHPYLPDLVRRERVYWQVRIYDENGTPGSWSELAWFEMGLMHREDWQARWITGDYTPQTGVRYPADCFRKVFRVTHARKARLYLTACGVYETRLNGKRVSDLVLTPGSTNYDVRLQYQTYDVTELLQEGDNEWTVELGDGWFRGNLGVFDTNNVFGDRTGIFGQLEWIDEMGVRQVQGTDETFAWCNDGPVYYTDIKGGERVDAARIPTYGGKAALMHWDAVLCCSNNVPVTEHERFCPTVLKTPKGETVLDFGQNIAGYPQFTIRAPRGTEVTLTMGEMLDKEGNFTLDNLLQRVTFQEDNRDFDKFQKVVYRCAGTGLETYKPKFCFQGFRYIRVENWPGEIRPEDITAIAVYSDMEICEEFSSSSADLNRIVENTLWSMKGNFLDVPTDCPTRERAGWTGDAQLFFNAGCYFMDVSAFFRKWLRDLYDDQAADGKIYNIEPRTAPHGGMNDYVEGSSGWTDAGILIPYRYWQHYFDIDLLKQYYQQMKKLMSFMLNRRGDTSDPELDSKLHPGDNRQYLVTTGFHFGEWNEPNKDVSMIGTGNYEEATAYLIYSLRHMEKIAAMLGETEDSTFYGKCAEQSTDAYLEYFLPDGTVQSDRMCKYVRPLALGLLDGHPQIKAKIQQGLIERVKGGNYHVGTGFLSTPFLLNTLTDASSPESAYRMLLKEGFPSWIYEIRCGATTIWEDWDGVSSRNHYSNGAVCDWVFNTVCGVRIAGENRFSVRPIPGAGLTYVQFRYHSPFGEVQSAWKREESTICFQIQLPVGCTGTVLLPDGEERKIGGGKKYTFRIVSVQGSV